MKNGYCLAGNYSLEGGFVPKVGWKVRKLAKILGNGASE
jgi:hypothetical protein